MPKHITAEQAFQMIVKSQRAEQRKAELRREWRLKTRQKRRTGKL
jgi:hypothetical protein